MGKDNPKLRVQSVLCIEIISFDWIPKPDFPCLGKFCPNFEILVDPVFLWITDSTNFRPYNKWIHISINTGLDYLGSIRKIGLKRFGQKTKDRVECKPSENWNFGKTTIKRTQTGTKTGDHSCPTEILARVQLIEVLNYIWVHPGAI